MIRPSPRETLRALENQGEDRIWRTAKAAGEAMDDLITASRRALNVLKATGESVRPGNALGALEAAIAKATGE